MERVKKIKIRKVVKYPKHDAVINAQHKLFITKEFLKREKLLDCEYVNIYVDKDDVYIEFANNDFQVDKFSYRISYQHISCYLFKNLERGSYSLIKIKDSLYKLKKGGNEND